MGLDSHIFVQVESGPDVMQSTAVDRAKFIGVHGIQGLEQVAAGIEPLVPAPTDDLAAPVRTACREPEAHVATDCPSCAALYSRGSKQRIRCCHGGQSRKFWLCMSPDEVNGYHTW